MTGEAGTPSDSPTPAAPLLRVARGNPTAHELAALVTTIAAAATPAAAPAPVQSRWASHRVALRVPHRVGRGEWQAWLQD